MSIEHPSTHPDQLLASYVDGSASPDERRTIDLHLTACARCREDVRAAREGMDAVRSLPSLAAPVIAAAVMDTVRAGKPANVSAVPPRTARQRAWRRRSKVSWLLAGSAAAAAAAVVALFVLLAGRPSTPANSSAAGARGSASSPSAVSAGHSYSKSSLDALTVSLAHRFAGTDLTSVPSSRHMASATPAPVAPAAPTSTSASACLAQGGAPPGRQVYLEVATVLGRSAYVGAYVESAPNGRVLALVAVSRSGCVPLYFGTHRI